MTTQIIDDQIREYDSWNESKKKIQLSEDDISSFPKEGEVWVTSFGKNIGFEQDGSGSNFSRPALVVKKFNNHMFWCVPLSTKQKQFDFYYNFIDLENQIVSAILAQLKLVSVKRMQRRLYEISPDTFREIKNRLRNFIA